MIKKILLVLLLCSINITMGFAADEDVSEIVVKVEKILSLENIRADQTMTVYRKDGTIRKYVMESMTSGKDKSFVELTAPPREKGRQVLRLGDVVWSYMPSVKKSIRVSGRGSFMGGDFENNDVLRLNLIGDYTYKIEEEKSDQYVLALKGKDLSLSYAKIKLWVQKKDFQPIKQEYYTLTDKLIKSTIYKDIKDFGGFKRPAQLVMQSALYPKQKTILEIKKIEIGVKNPSKRFRRSGLGK